MHDGHVRDAAGSTKLKLKSRYNYNARPTKLTRNMVGIRQGRIFVLGFAGRAKKSGTGWLCRCDCGQFFVADQSGIRRGIASCGCLRTEWPETRINGKKTHGMARTPAYKCWVAMKERCYNQNAKIYKDYGGRGITICERWLHSFENFIADMGLRPSPRHSIERKNNDGNYEPDNCCWATQSEQNRNRRQKVYVEINGEKLSFTVIAERYGILRHTLDRRHRTGWCSKCLILPTDIYQKCRHKMSWDKVKGTAAAWSHIRTTISGDRDSVTCTICNYSAEMEEHKRESVLRQIARVHYYSHRLWERMEELPEPLPDVEPLFL